MVAYLEKTGGNAEFHDIIDFLTRSSIYYALTGKKNSGNMTPLFPFMLAQPTEDEGEVSERPSEESDLSLKPSSSIPIPDSILEDSGGNHRAKQIQALKAQIKKLKKKAKPVISHHNAWIKSVSMKKRLARKKFWDDLDDAMDYMETEDAHDEGTVRTVKKHGSMKIPLFLEIDPKDKGKKVLEEEAESDAESEGQDLMQTRFLLRSLQEEEREKAPLSKEPSFFIIPLLWIQTCSAEQKEVRNTMMLKVKRENENFIPISSAKDENLIEKMNKKADGMDKEEVSEETKKENHLKTFLKIVPEEEEKIDYEVLGEWKSVCLGTKLQYDETKDIEEINLNMVVRSNGQKRFFSTLMKELSIFDREDLKVVYKLVMERYQDEIPEGFDRVLWGDLMIMFNPSDEDEFWNSQQD
ncbi:hypothetical protein Tco_0724069 [Tanacetum coccineum]